MSQPVLILFGASGTLGKAAAAALAADFKIVPVSHSKSEFKVDYGNPASIASVLKEIESKHGRARAIISAAGPARFAPVDKLSDADYAFSVANKLMGQVNLARAALDHLEDNGSLTLTAGALARFPAVGSTAVSMVNAGLEGFVRALALEAPRGIRVNVVSPPWIAETLQARGMDPSKGKPAALAGTIYAQSVMGTDKGKVFDV